MLLNFRNKFTGIGIKVFTSNCNWLILELPECSGFVANCLFAWVKSNSHCVLNCCEVIQNVSCFHTLRQWTSLNGLSNSRWWVFAYKSFLSFCSHAIILKVHSHFVLKSCICFHLVQRRKYGYIWIFFFYFGKWRYNSVLMKEEKGAQARTVSMTKWKWNYSI